jgi:hypothetical protein
MKSSFSEGVLQTNPVNRIRSIVCRYKIIITTLVMLSISYMLIQATIPPSYVQFQNIDNGFPLVANGKSAAIVVDTENDRGILHAVEDLRLDIERVTSQKPNLRSEPVPDDNVVVIIGTLGKSRLVQELVQNNQLDVSGIENKWEAFLITTVTYPAQGIEKALIIAGNDRRGTIYGIYDLSARIGVSPWYWWADVPVKRHPEIYITPGVYSDFPVVRYRGIFLNDEAPALSGWANEKFGGFNHEFYAHVFELILRLRGNFLWPAMWGSAFFDDDTLNPKTADEYGIVIGTSHHEPMLRAHDEWRRYGKGPWNYETNSKELQKFWRESIRERKKYETIITVGMRGDGDEAMTEGTAIALLERIITDQRKILAEETGKDPSELPQAWALYKEVQDYYDKGMQVPDDITLLLCDDNWGNIRRLPIPGTPTREGGYGMYYHYDFVGGPVSYRWLNVNPISRTWEQMHLTYEHGVDRIWIVNVGDLKPMEFPTDFFLDYAWNPDRITADSLPSYTREWAEEQFGPGHALEIAELLTQYTRFNYRRTPEMLSPETYSLFNYREAETVVKDYKDLLVSAKKIETGLTPEYRDAFYQLVLHPIEACSNLNELYYTVAKNHLYASQKRNLTNAMAQKAEELFEYDAAITDYYNQVLSDGKWNHFMSQTHIGYTSWNNPDKNYMPKVKEITLPKKPEMGVMIEGSESWWPNYEEVASLPEFDNFNNQSYYIELFNRGAGNYDFSIVAKNSWVLISQTRGTIESEKRIWIQVDWNKIPVGKNESDITIKSADGKTVIVNIKAIKHTLPEPGSFHGFIEANGYISMEAEHFTAYKESEEIHWQVIPGFGRTLSGVTAFPTTHPPVIPEKDSPRLEYNVYLYSSGNVKVDCYIAPSLNIYNNEGMEYAVSFDDALPQIVKIHEFDTIPDWKYPAYWNKSVTDNIRILSTEHTIEHEGPHILKFWMVTPGVVLEKIVIETGEIGDSYLGPPESFRQE